MEKLEFLNALAYDELSDEQIVQEFSRHYIAEGLAIKDACREICLMASMSAAKEAGEKLANVFCKAGDAVISFRHEKSPNSLAAN